MGMNLDGKREGRGPVSLQRHGALSQEQEEPGGGLRYRGLAFHKELFDCSEERGFEEEAMADGHV